MMIMALFRKLFAFPFLIIGYIFVKLGCAVAGHDLNIKYKNTSSC